MSGLYDFDSITEAKHPYTSINIEQYFLEPQAKDSVARPSASPKKGQN